MMGAFECVLALVSFTFN